MNRSPEMQKFVDEFSRSAFGRSNSESIAKRVCVTCGQPVCDADFRNEISRREYRISGMCCKCQDSVFGVD